MLARSPASPAYLVTVAAQQARAGRRKGINPFLYLCCVLVLHATKCVLAPAQIDEVAAPEERTPSTPAYASPLKARPPLELRCSPILVTCAPAHVYALECSAYGGNNHKRHYTRH